MSKYSSSIPSIFSILRKRYEDTGLTFYAEIDRHRVSTKLFPMPGNFGREVAANDTCSDYIENNCYSNWSTDIVFDLETFPYQRVLIYYFEDPWEAAMFKVWLDGWSP